MVYSSNYFTIAILPNLLGIVYDLSLTVAVVRRFGFHKRDDSSVRIKDNSALCNKISQKGLVGSCFCLWCSFFSSIKLRCLKRYYVSKEQANLSHHEPPSPHWLFLSHLNFYSVAHFFVIVNLPFRKMCGGFYLMAFKTDSILPVVSSSTHRRHMPTFTQRPGVMVLLVFACYFVVLF